MDALIILEGNQENILAGSGSSSGTKTVAVEYGNYLTKVMQTKIEGSNFDEAYIFAKKEYISKYESKIITSKIVHYRTI